MECLRLRVKDVDFNQHHILVRAGKGDKDRVTLVRTTMVHTHTVQSVTLKEAKSPLDF